LHNPENAMDWPLKLKIALDISEGMEFLHGSTPPIIHRDLKTPKYFFPSILFFALLFLSFSLSSLAPSILY
jgi:serine/threonine protein kinase